MHCTDTREERASAIQGERAQKRATCPALTLVLQPQTCEQTAVWGLSCSGCAGLLPVAQGTLSRLALPLGSYPVLSFSLSVSLSLPPCSRLPWIFLQRLMAGVWLVPLLQGQDSERSSGPSLLFSELSAQKWMAKNTKSRTLPFVRILFST